MPDPIKNPLPPKCIVLLYFVLLLFSSCLTQEQRKQKAIEYGQKGLEADQKRNYEEALKYYNQGIDLDSTNPALFLGRGNVMYNVFDTNKALHNYRKALSLDTINSITYKSILYNLGVGYSEQNKLDSSIFWAKKLVSIDSNFLDAYLTLGIVYFKLTKYDSALYYLQLVDFEYPTIVKQYNNYSYSDQRVTKKVIKNLGYFYQGLCYNHIRNIEKAKHYLSLASQSHIAGAQDSLNTLLK